MSEVKAFTRLDGCSHPFAKILEVNLPLSLRVSVLKHDLNLLEVGGGSTKLCNILRVDKAIIVLINIQESLSYWSPIICKLCSDLSLYHLNSFTNYLCGSFIISCSKNFLLFLFFLCLWVTLVSLTVWVSWREEELFEKLKVHWSIPSLREKFLFPKKIWYLFMSEWQSVDQQSLEEVLLINLALAAEVHIWESL